MVRDILFAAWFFLPAGFANMVPVLVTRVPILKNYNQPIDGGIKFRSIPLFGSHKTWRGLFSGIIIAIFVLWLQVILYDHISFFKSVSNGIAYNHLSIFGLGFLFGLGALGGDIIESFFKRQLNILPGKSLFPFDQIDYIIGGLVASTAIVTLSFWQYVWIVITWLILHLVAGLVGFLIGVKDKPI